MAEPVYVSMEGLCDSSSQSEDEEQSCKDEGTGRKSARKDFVLDESVYKEGEERELDSGDDSDNAGKSSKESGDDNILALSKKQLNRLAAMDIYAIPSGGIGTVNASLFNPVTIKWLMKNFETVEGSSLPRYLVYSHYLLHCKSLNIKPINAASFGKVIRSVFLGLQTRRLGTRGNSKYHYCGMRIKPDSPLLNVVVDDVEPKRTRHVPNEEKTVRKKTVVKTQSMWTAKMFELWKEKYLTQLPEDYVVKRYYGLAISRNLTIASDYANTISDGLNRDEIFTFKWFYAAHCKLLIDAVAVFNLEQVGLLWHQFYDLDWDKIHALMAQTRNYPEGFIADLTFTRSKMKKFVSVKSIQAYISEADKQTYGLISFLLCPTVTANVPVEVNNVIRIFLAVAETWLLDSLGCYPEDFKSMKLTTLQNTVRPLQHALNTNSLFFSLQQAIDEREKVEELKSAIEKINFGYLDARINWITQGMVSNLSTKLKEIIQQSDIPLALVKYVENMVEKHIDKCESLGQSRMKLQQFFLALNYRISNIKSKLVFIGEVPLEVLLMIEGFLLAYLKFYTHQRTENHTQVNLTGVEVEAWKTDIDVLKRSSVVADVNGSTNVVPKIEASELLADTWLLQQDLEGSHFEDLKGFLATGDVPDYTQDITSVQETSVEDPLTIDESFSSYFSASGYVTNYFSSGFSHLDFSDSEDQDEKSSAPNGS